MVLGPEGEQDLVASLSGNFIRVEDETTCANVDVESGSESGRDERRSKEERREGQHL
jgi:hypothetical protein